ncbi:MAG: hypothetical protein N3E50_02990 [Candidatus Goldbacteria bacterium]|nr:hypothetical protein [Candidatus Goldiibacteriota bacterium]
MSRKKLFFFLCIIVFIFSCTTSMEKFQPFLDYSNVKLQDIIIEPVDEKQLLVLIEKLRKKIYGMKKDEKEVDEIVLEMETVVNLYKSYINIDRIADYTDGTYKIPGKTSVTVNVNTYCLNINAAAPVKNEPYILISGEPDIAFFKEIMKYTNSKEFVDQRLKQKLLWDLQNHVKFEMLPEDEKSLLLRIDSNAYLKTDSFVKDMAKDILIQFIPGIKQIKKATNIIKGVSYKYDEYARNIELLISQEPIPEISGPVKSEGFNLYTMIEPDSYKHAKITFINIDDKDEKIDCGYFKPIRKDVQPLAFDLPTYYEKKLNNEIKKAFAQLEVATIDAYGRYTDKPFKLEKGDRWFIEEHPDRILDFWKAFQDRNKAIKMTKKFCEEYPQMCNNNAHNDRGDAFRHALWNALMQRDVGDFAIDLANAHELNEGKVEENDMDKYNNEIGREIGARLKQKKVKDDDAYYKEILENIDRLRHLK